MTILLFPCHSEEFRQKADDEESKIHSFILFEILHSASLHSEWLIMLSCHSESAIWRTKNLKMNSCFQRALFVFCLFNLFNELNQNPSSLKKRRTLISKKIFIHYHKFYKRFFLAFGESEWHFCFFPVILRSPPKGRRRI